MRIKRLTLYSILLLLMILLTACGTSATPEGAINSKPTLLAPSNTGVSASTDTSAPQPSETTIPPTEPAASTVSFAHDVFPIFQSRCINCHGGEQTKEGLDLKTYDSLMSGSNNGFVLTPGNSNDSLIVKQIIEGKMPKRGPKLPPSQVQVIVDWVNAGALNN